MMRPKSALYYTKDIETIAIEFTDKLKSLQDSENRVKVGRACQEYALDSISCIFLGEKIGALSETTVANNLIENMGIFMKHGLPMFLLSPSRVEWYPFYRKTVKASTDVIVAASRLVEKAIDNIDIEDITDESILAKLVRKHGKDSKVPLIMAIDAIGAGIDTTGNQASFLLYHLAKHPEVQEKLYDEIQACIAKDGSLTADSLMKMRYLKACQQESQRLLPVTSGVSRETQVIFNANLNF